MRKIFLFIFFLAISRISYSQFTITQQQMPQAGDTIYMQKMDPTNFDPGGYGPNVSWDYSNLSVLQHNYSVSPYQDFTFSCSPTDSGYLFKTNYPQGTVQGGMCYVSDSTEFSFIYSRFIQTQYIGTSQFIYRDRKSLMIFPFNYNDTFRDSSIGGGWSTPGAQYNYLNEMLEKTYDSYGELTLPWGYYPNVARVHFNSLVRDSSSANGSSLGIVNYQSLGYEWYDMNTHDFILSYSINTQSASLNRVLLAQSNSSVGIFEASKSSNLFSVFPNPSQGKFDIKMPAQFKKGSDINLEIFDALGKCIYQKEIEINDYSIKIDLGKPAKGIYNATLSNSKAVFHSRIVMN